MEFNGRKEAEAVAANVQTERARSADLRTEGLEVCSVCRTALSSSVAPKLLPCLHAVCKSCISKNNDDGNAKECSVCGQSFSLSEVTDCFIFEDSKPKCGGCEESALSGWCVQCEEALCSDCVLAHQRVKVTRNHTVLPQETPSGFTATMRCTSHRQERLKFICLICDELTCKDCQLIYHRGHSFLLLEEALVSQKEQLQKLLYSIREQRVSVKASLLDLDERLHCIMESKGTAKKKVVKFVQSMSLMLWIRGRQLVKDVEELYKEEENSILERKKSLTSLENRQEYITSFIQKILSTEGQCIVLHRKQILKRVESLLSQKTCLNKTILQPCLLLNQDVVQNCKTFGLVKVNRVPFIPKKKCEGSSEYNNASKEDNSASDICFMAVLTPPTLANEKSKTAPDLFQCEDSGPTSLKLIEAQPTQTSDSVLPLVKSKCEQSKVPTVSCAGASSVSPHCANVQTPLSINTQLVAAQESHALLQSVASHSVTQELSQSKKISRSHSHPSTSHPLPHTSTPSQTVLKTSVSKQSSARPTPAESSPPQYYDTRMKPHPTFTQPHHSTSVYTAQSNSGSGTTQSPSLVLGHPGSLSVPVASILAPSAHFGQGTFNHQPNISSGHTQQIFPLSQSIFVQSAQPQPLHFNWPLQAAPTSGPLPRCPSTSTAKTMVLQHSQSAVNRLNPLLFSLLCNSNAVTATPVPIVNQTPSLTAPTLLLTAPGSVPVGTIAGTSNTPNVAVASSTGENKNSRHLMLSQVACSLPIVPDVPVTPNNDTKECANAAPSKPPLTAAQTTVTSNTPAQRTCAQKPNCELPVQAPADSVCDRDIIMHGRTSPAVEEPDDNLPTSTVSEAETKELESVHEQYLPSSPSPDPLSSVSVSECPPCTSSPTLLKSQLSSTLPTTESTALSKHWGEGMPTTLRQLLEPTDASANKAEGADNTEDAVPTSDSEHGCLPHVMQEDDEETDVSDSETLEGKNVAAISKRKCRLTENHNKSLCVSLLRLPISVPTSGSHLPQYHISYDHTDEILLQELEEGQSMQRCFRIPTLPDAASPSQSIEYPQLNTLLDCAVCLSAGATLICAECGRNFHSDCHVPPILFRPIEVWVCSQCQDLFDDTDPFSYNRLKEPYLSLQDQRRCEQLLLTLMCKEHSYLLYQTTKQTAGCVEFDFIHGRLMGKQTPPYRSAAELVSDLWALFDNLLADSKKTDLVVQFQTIFQEQLLASFGKSLHASLLRPTGRVELKGAPKTELEKDKASTTLKRMREFLATNIVPVGKKARTESTSTSGDSNVC